jgi:hypothetical protein
MTASLARVVGRMTLLLVSLTIITGVSLLLFGSYLLTWPVLRLSPANRKVRAIVDLSAAAMAALAALQPQEGEHGNGSGNQS